jgi:hypothetical protein
MPNEPCRYLRTKAMYVDGPPPGETPQGAPPAPPPVNYWCNRTLTEVGPDDRLVNPRDCLAEGRPCYARK